MERVRIDAADRAIRHGDFDHWGELRAGRYECGACGDTRRDVIDPRRAFRGHLSGSHLDNVINALEEE